MGSIIRAKLALERSTCAPTRHDDRAVSMSLGKLDPIRKSVVNVIVVYADAADGTVMTGILLLGIT
jgi:hypothetical protein